MRPMCPARREPSVNRMSNNPIALVTGASRGLGRAVAAGLVREGYTLITDARDEAVLAAAARQDGIALAVPGDVTDPAHREELRAAAEKLGGLNLLVNNAGTLGAHPLPAMADYPVDELRAAFEVNVLAPVALTQLLLPELRVSGGAVLNITSDAAVEPYAGWGGYGSSKAALDQVSAILAEEHPALRIYSVDPGDMRTQMHQDAFPGEDISDRPPPEDSVPGLLTLIEGDLPSGRYRARELTPHRAVAA